MADTSALQKALLNISTDAASLRAFKEDACNYLIKAGVPDDQIVAALSGDPDRIKKFVETGANDTVIIILLLA